MNIDIISIIVSSSISIITMTITGAFALKKYNKRFEDLKTEIITTENAKRYIEERDCFYYSQDEFNKKIKYYLDTQTKGITIVQECVDFYQNHCKHYYYRNKEFFKESSVHESFTEIENKIENLQKNSDSDKVDLANMIISFGNLLKSSM